MKKALLLIGLIAIFLPGYAQTLNPSPSTITSGGTLTITGAGETNSAYFSSVSWDPTLITYSDGIQRNWVTTQSITDQSFYNIATHTPTSFKMKILNGSNQAYTVTIGVRTNISNFTAGTSPQLNVLKYFTVTVNPTPVITTFTNAIASRVFYKNDCPTGFSSDPFTYTIPAGTYSSQISQADADGKAIAAINTNGQNAANAARTCKLIYYNAETSASFTKNDCTGSSIPGDHVIYTVPASKFTSLISQADADSQAQADISANGQNFANTNSTCIVVPYILSGSGWRGQDYSVQVLNTSIGDTFEWIVPSNAATIMYGQGTTLLGILLKNTAGTLPYTFTITVKVTSTNGLIKTYTAPFVSKFCGQCPQ